MLSLNKNNITIYFETDKDKYTEYFNRLINDSKDILKFFNKSELDKPLDIIIWYDLDEYRIHRNKWLKQFKKEVQDWEIASSINHPKSNHLINLLTYNEMIKTEGHSNMKEEDEYLTLLHEFIHTVHSEYKNYKDALTCVNEGLACYLSGQYKYKSPIFNSNRVDMVKGNTSYDNYYLFMKYMLENRDREYVLEFIKNPRMQKNDFDQIFNDFLLNKKRKM